MNTSASGPRRVTPSGRTRWGGEDRRHDGSTRVRFGLQLRAPHNLRRHAWRAVRRFAVLLIADLFTYYLMRALLRGVRDSAVLGSYIATTLQQILPKGILNGWQFAAALLVGMAVTGNYRRGDARRNPRRLLLGCALATALPLWMTIWARGVEFVALQYLLTTSLVWLGLVVERLTLDRIVSVVSPPEEQAARTVFVGSADQCRVAMAGAAFSARVEFLPIGYVDVHFPAAPDAIGGIEDFHHLVHESRAESVVICGYLSDAQFQDVVDASLAAGCQLLSVPRASAVAGVQPAMMWRRGQALIELTAPSLKGQQLVVKRLLDVIGAGIGMVLLSPIFLFCALIVKWDSSGPAIFWQERVGRGGRRFRIFKFRTMVLDAESRRAALMGDSIYKDPRLFKIPADPRVTRVGQWMRRTSLDELPQLWNVLRGEMSLVGPRPPLPSEVELYEIHHYARFDVKPGITGPWQVNGRNQITDFERVVALETEYVREWSVMSDFLILLKTVVVVAQMRGAH